MSYTTVLAVYPNEKFEELFELRNAWGTAPVVWDAMAQTYLRKSNFMVCGNELWPLWKDKTIPEVHRAVHLITFDRAYIEKKDFQRAAADIRTFLKDFPPQENRVNHWTEIADYLETNPDVPAIGFHMTSVTENLYQGDWNEEIEDYDAPDWDRFYSVYSSLEEEANHD
ncbi:hypothetical protein OHW25_12790 [Acinetobacter baumannii]|nr:hypothetical protein [Acinetobacter baumannii]